MGRELQKKKNRSSISKVRHKPKSKKRLLQHPVIAANWDRSQTLEQNYRRLGLTTKLNKNSGGQEKKVSDVLRAANGEDEQNARDALKIISSSSRRKEQIEVSEVQIERDPETGMIIRVIDDAAEAAAKANPLNDPLAEFDSDEDEQQGLFELKNQHGNTNANIVNLGTGNAAKTEVIRKLEEEARLPAVKKKRKQPEGEREFVETLVRKYGDDVGRMVRDMKINYMQRSEGDLKRRIKRWREAGGTID